MKMEKQTLGEFFSETRKEKGISVDEIVRDTNIPKRYLEAIEADNFDIFPGETYSMGFIANYADALEVDRDLVIGMYKRQMKIEQDAPIEQLVGNKKTFTLNNNTLIAIGGGLGALLLLILISVGVRQSQISAEKAERNRPSQFAFSFDDVNGIVNQKFRIGDTITVTNGTNTSRTVTINFVSLGQNRVLNLKVNNKTYNAHSGELLSVDADNNGTNDVGIELITAKEKEIKFSLTLLSYSADGTNAGLADNIYNQVKEYILSESEVFVTNVRSDVNMKITGIGTGYLSYTADNKETREFNLANGSLLNVVFNHHLILYFGNSGAAKLSVGSREDTGGGWGEVGKSIYYWKEKGNQFALIRAVLK